MNLKKIIYLVILIVILALFIYAVVRPSDIGSTASDKINVVCTSFVGYDFVRAITNGSENIEITYLLDPGVDAHTFEPSASQLIAIQSADLFVYNGGEMENWTEQIIPTLDLTNTTLVRLMDTVELLEEEDVDGAEEEESDELEWDEHVWTSPANAIQILESLELTLEEIDPEETELFKENTISYKAEIEDLDEKIWDIVNNAKRTRLIFGDRMPIRYFLEEFGLQASAAFNGCSTEVEPSTKTISYLIDLVREEEIPVVLYIENGNTKVAGIIAEETGAIAMEFQSLHTISSEDYNNGETYVTLMERNLEVLKAALQ